MTTTAQTTPLPPLPTEEEVRRAVTDALHRLSYYAGGAAYSYTAEEIADRRNALARMVAASLPARVARAVRDDVADRDLRVVEVVAGDAALSLISDRHPTVDLPAHLEGPRLPTTYRPS